MRFGSTFFVLLTNITILFSVFISSIALPKDCGDCFSELHKLNRLIDQSVDKPSHLPRPKPYKMVIKPARAKEMADLAVANWESYYSPKRFRKIIDKVIKGEVLNSDEAKELKALRKRSLALKNLFKTLDRAHKPPHKLANFNSILGKLNDSRPKYPNPTAQRYAHMLLGLMDFKAEFSPDAHPSQYVEARKSRIRHYLRKDSLTEVESHEVRKMIRQLLAVVNLNQVLNPSSKGEAQTVYLQSLSRAVAGFRDHASSPYVFPSDLKAQIRAGLDGLEVSP